LFNVYVHLQIPAVNKAVKLLQNITNLQLLLFTFKFLIAMQLCTVHVYYITD